MHDSNQSETQPEQSETSVARTQELPGVLPDRIAPENEAAFLAGQEKVLEMINANAPLGDVLTSLVLLMEAQSPEMLCSVLLLSDDGDHIRHGAAPSLPEEYVKAVDGAPIGPRNGSCGTAMWRGKPVIVTDILADPSILSGKGKVLGSFAMYYREPRAPTGVEARLTEVATRLAGKAIEQRVARERLGAAGLATGMN